MTYQEKIADITGRKYGRLKVIGVARLMGKRRIWRCQCTCGGLAEAAKFDLERGHTTSCGCIQRERSKAANTQHGYSHKHPIWITWKNIRQRCRNRNKADWPYYGGRGIKVCRRWSKFEHFMQDMLPGWSPGLTIERIDNDGDYTPENCRWATRKEQCQNCKPWGYYKGRR